MHIVAAKCIFPAPTHLLKWVCCSSDERTNRHMPCLLSFSFNYYFLSFSFFNLCVMKWLCRFWTIEPIALNKPCASGLTRKTVYRFHCECVCNSVVFVCLLLLCNTNTTRTTSFQKKKRQKTSKLEPFQFSNKQK